MLSVEDNGKGFDPKKIVAGTGLENIRMRVASFSGIFHLNSSPNNGMEANVEFRMKNEK
jgi:two-component system sensor histidine kinase UhpB